MTASDQQKMATLHMAHSEGCGAVVRLTLEYGADVAATEDQFVETPLDEAAVGGYEEAIRLPLDEIADVNPQEEVSCDDVIQAEIPRDYSVMDQLLLEDEDMIHSYPFL